MKTAISVVSSPEFENADSPQLPFVLLGYLSHILDTAQENCAAFRKEIFNSILNSCSSIDLAGLKALGDSLLLKLSNYCGLKSVHDLYSIELSSALQDFTKEYLHWTKTSPRRFAFEILIKTKDF